MTENCTNDASNILSVAVTCRSSGLFLIWGGEMFLQELAVTIESTEHTFKLAIPDLQVTDKIPIIDMDSCFQSTLTFSGPNIKAITNASIYCRTGFKEDMYNINVPNCELSAG